MDIHPLPTIAKKKEGRFALKGGARRLTPRAAVSFLYPQKSRGMLTCSLEERGRATTCSGIQIENVDSRSNSSMT